MSSRDLKEQLRLNVEYILDEYLNGMSDYPEEYGEMSVDECRSYVVERLYDIKVMEPGHVRERTGICEELKFLGNEEIYSLIDSYARDSGILKEQYVNFKEFLNQCNEKEEGFNIFCGGEMMHFSYQGSKGMKLTEEALKEFATLLDSTPEVREADMEGFYNLYLPKEYEGEASVFVSIAAGVCSEDTYKSMFGERAAEANDELVLHRDVCIIEMPK